MAKTAKQVQGDIYQLLKESRLATQLSGGVYRGTPESSYRPRDSQKEDAIAIFTAGKPGQVQTGAITVNIYVPDIDPYNNGIFAEDGKRTAEIEQLAQEWVDSLIDNVYTYDFEQSDTIYTEAEPKINQHFVVVKLKYKLCE
jgi:hypothetical protein